jgi:ADP-ribose pyrophosphatase YjhB (NUDIX family)
VSDADRDYDFDNVIVRCIQFRRELDFFSSFREVQLHIREKYRSDGYLKEFYYKQKPSEIQEKFDLFSDDDNFALNEFARIYGPLVFDMNIISFFDRSSVDHGPEFIDRDAVRGVCIKNGKILLVHLEKSGEYKFPGGGVNNGETRHEALRREMLEEAGVSNIMSIKDFGVAIQKQNSNLEDGIFYQKSHYYFVDDFDDNSFCESNLDDYEVDLGMKPKWIDIDEAIINNEEIMLDANRNPWVDRDTLILHLVKEIM